MPVVTVAVNGRPYEIACGDGEEAQVVRLADAVDRRVQQLRRELGPVDDARLLLLVCLLQADELADLRAGAPGAAPAAPLPPPAGGLQTVDAAAPAPADAAGAGAAPADGIVAIAEGLDGLAERIDAVTGQLCVDAPAASVVASAEPAS